MKKILYCLIIFFIIIIIAYTASPISNKLSLTAAFYFITNTHWIMPLVIAFLFFGVVLIILSEREKNLDWQEEFRDRKRKERKEKGEDEPYESYF